MVYSTRRFVVCLSMCHFVLVFFSPFGISITSLGEERANLSAFRTFVRFVLVWICWFPIPFGVLEGLRFVIVALPGLFSYLFWMCWATFWSFVIHNSYALLRHNLQYVPSSFLTDRPRRQLCCIIPFFFFFFFFFFFVLFCFLSFVPRLLFCDETVLRD